jgi:nucleotide-binding universal stress UspA family protein
MKVKQILAPTDLSPPSLEAVEYAVDLARTLDAEVILLFVQEAPFFGPEPDAYVVSANFRLLFVERQRVLREQMAALHTKLGKRGARCRAVLGEGSAAAQILATARKVKADLIVMATHGRTGAKRMFLGSVAEKVVRGASFGLLATRQAGGLAGEYRRTHASGPRYPRRRRSAPSPTSPEPRRSSEAGSGTTVPVWLTS